MPHASYYRGAVRLEIARAPRTLPDCNGSICGRLGARRVYYSRKAVRVLCPKGATRAYSYGRKTYEYHHGKVCGCVTHYVRINMKCDDRVAANACMMNPDSIASVPI